MNAHDFSKGAIPEGKPDTGSPAVSVLSPAKYRLRLFIAGSEPNSLIAQRNITEICSTYFDKDYELVIIDVFEDFKVALEENIVVTPTLIVDRPEKMRIHGNLQDRDTFLMRLGLT
jgi:circadian clock protein KaiB